MLARLCSALRIGFAWCAALIPVAGSATLDAQQYGYYGRYTGSPYGVGYYGSVGYPGSAGYYGGGAYYRGTGYYGSRYSETTYYGSGVYGAGYGVGIYRAGVQSGPAYYDAGTYGWAIYGGAGIDPIYYVTPTGSGPSPYSAATWQTDPFAVGYNLLSGYRPIYSGARQPSGHEVIWTGENSYVYRPTYSPSTTSSRLAWGGGPLVIDYPGTDHAKYYSASGRVWEADPSAFAVYQAAAAMPLEEVPAGKVPEVNVREPEPPAQGVAPARAASPTPRGRGPREF